MPPKNKLSSTKVLNINTSLPKLADLQTRWQMNHAVKKEKCKRRNNHLNTLYIMLYQLGMNIFIKKIIMLSLVYDMCIRYDWLKMTKRQVLYLKLC